MIRRLLAYTAPIVAAIGATSGTAAAAPATATAAHVMTDGVDSACQTGSNLGDIAGAPTPDDCSLPQAPRS